MKKIIGFVCTFSIIAALAGMNTDHLNKPQPTQPDIQKSIARGKKVFSKYCISCHQADGDGVPNLNPPLIKTPYVLGDKEKLVNIVLNGLNAEIEIEDQVFTNPMPALNILKDQEIADVLTYVRNSFGNKASAVTPSEVKNVRGKKK